MHGRARTERHEGAHLMMSPESSMAISPTYLFSTFSTTPWEARSSKGCGDDSAAGMTKVTAVPAERGQVS